MIAADYKATRSRLGTQADVAALLGVARGTVARRETGALPITQEAALALDALSSAAAKKRPARGKRAAMRASNVLLSEPLANAPKKAEPCGQRDGQSDSL